MVFQHNLNPVFLNILGIEIRYYGLIFVLGIVIAYFMLKHFSKKSLLKLNQEQIVDLMFYIIISVFIFSRLFYVLFYNFGYYLANPLHILYFWQGGLSFHGGFIGALIGAYLYRRKNKFDFWNFADMLVIPLALGLGFGRIGNFINGELYGRITSLSIGVKFPYAEGLRHPSQLYEALKNFIIFTTLWFLKDRKLPKGFLFWTFVTMYGLFRFFIEFFRAPDPQLGFIIFNLTMGQLFCLIMIIVGSYILYKLTKYKKGN